MSSKKRIAPSSSISHGVPIVCIRSQRQPPTSGAVTFPPWIDRTHGSSGLAGTSPAPPVVSTSSRRSFVNVVVSASPTPMSPFPYTVASPAFWRSATWSAVMSE